MFSNIMFTLISCLSPGAYSSLEYYVYYYTIQLACVCVLNGFISSVPNVFPWPWTTPSCHGDR